MTKQLRRGLATALIMAATSLGAAPLVAAPADYAPALADSARSDANRQLDAERMPAQVLDFAGIKRGDTVADFYAGAGYYTELLADVVGPKGRIYALEQSNFYKPEPWAALTKAHPNVIPIVAPANGLVLAPGSVDAIFAHLVYHDLYWVSDKYQHPRIDVPTVLKGWFAAVKPGGTVVIVDHVGPAGDPRAVVDKLHRIDPEQVKRDMAAAGFVLDGESDVLHRSDDDHSKNVFDPSVRGKTDRFMLKFRRPASNTNA